MSLLEGESVQVTEIFPRNRKMTVRAFFPARQSATVLLSPTTGDPA